MKIAYVSASDGRGQTRERHRRERAAAPSMEISYPRLSLIRLDFGFKDDGPFTPVPQSTVLHPPARAYFVFPCPYSDCDGQFDLADRIELMIDAGELRCDGELHCVGKRYRGNQGLAACGLTLKYLIDAQRR